MLRAEIHSAHITRNHTLIIAPFATFGKTTTKKISFIVMVVAFAVSENASTIHIATSVKCVCPSATRIIVWVEMPKTIRVLCVTKTFRKVTKHLYF